MRSVNDSVVYFKLGEQAVRIIKEGGDYHVEFQSGPKCRFGSLSSFNEILPALGFFEQVVRRTISSQEEDGIIRELVKSDPPAS